MARNLRWEYAGACYHVINFGNHRRQLFAARERRRRRVMGGASSVSSLVTRFQRQGLVGTAAFQALYSRFAT